MGAWGYREARARARRAARAVHSRKPIRRCRIEEPPGEVNLRGRDRISCVRSVRGGNVPLGFCGYACSTTDAPSIASRRGLDARVGTWVRKARYAADYHGDWSHHRVCISLFLLLRLHDDDVPHRRIGVLHQLGVLFATAIASACFAIFWFLPALSRPIECKSALQTRKGVAM